MSERGPIDCGATTCCTNVSTSIFLQRGSLERNRSARFGLKLKDGVDSGDAGMKAHSLRLLIASVAIAGFAGAAQADSYSKAVQQSCRDDYKKFCSDYGLESSALRGCMDRAGKSLSKDCVQALVQSGEVSQAEVDHRRKLGH